MGTFTWVGLVIVVAIAAFFVGAFVTKKQFKQDELEQQAEQAKHSLRAVSPRCCRPFSEVLVS